MSTFKKVLEQIELNRHKKDNCFPFKEKLPRFSKFVKGIQKNRYYLISGASGSGKSQFTDSFFVFTPLDYVMGKHRDITVKILYYSLELDKETKMIQWIMKRLYDVYGMRIDADIINSVGDLKLSDDIMMAIRETQDYFERATQYMEIRDTPLTAEEILRDVHTYAKKHGKVFTKKEDGKEVFDYYVPDNPEEYVEIVVDHFSLLKESPGCTIKQSIENLSKGFIEVRNKYGYIPVGIQQQNAEKENVEHFKVSKMEPSKDGLAESKLTYNDCDVALGLFNPYKHEIKNYRGYDISRLGDKYRNLNVFKNRFGIPHLNAGLYFDGCTATFRELPASREIESRHYEMIERHSPNW